MTRDEVFALLGEPGDYTDGEYVQANTLAYRPHVAVWTCEGGELSVTFDENSRADWVFVMPVVRTFVTRLSPWERFVARLGL